MYMWRIFFFVTASGAGAAATKQEQPATPASTSPHFITGADGFLRASSRKVGDAAATVLDVQSGLDDMAKDIRKEYAIWDSKKNDLSAQRSHLVEEIQRMQSILMKQSSEREENARLQEALDQQSLVTARITKDRELVSSHWTLQSVALHRDISILEEQLNASQTEKVKKIKAATARVSAVQAQNRAMQSEIFNTNQRVFELSNFIANQTVAYKQEHSQLLSEVLVLQEHIHFLQDDVVERAKLQLELQRRWKRLAAQASEVVQQKEELKQARIQCEKELSDIDGQIGIAQQQLKSFTVELVSCQKLDAQNQMLQGKLNECKAARG